MRAPAVAIVATGAANIASVQGALARCGASSVVTDRAEAVLAAPYVVLPGVGSFGAAMHRLSQRNLIEPLRERIVRNRPTLAICLGLHLFTLASEESPGVAGIGVISASVRRISGAVRVPQFGWNRIIAPAEGVVLQSGYGYFANSFVLPECDASWQPAFADYGGRFVAAIEQGAVVACQFHPELSGAWGAELISRWLSCGAPAC